MNLPLLNVNWTLFHETSGRYFAFIINSVRCPYDSPLVGDEWHKELIIQTTLIRPLSAFAHLINVVCANTLYKDIVHLTRLNVCHDARIIGLAGENGPQCSVDVEVRVLKDFM